MDEGQQTSGLRHQLEYMLKETAMHWIHTSFDSDQIRLLQLVSRDWVGPVFVDVLENESTLIHLT